MNDRETLRAYGVEYRIGDGGTLVLTATYEHPTPLSFDLDEDIRHEQVTLKRRGRLVVEAGFSWRPEFDGDPHEPQVRDSLVFATIESLIETASRTPSRPST